MKIASYAIVVLIMTFFNINVKAQSKDTIDAFITEIENYLLNVNKDISDLHIGHSGTGRKITMWGTFDNKSKIFRHKINFNCDGVKEERIGIYYLGISSSKNFLLEMLIINDKISYVKKLTYSSTLQILTKEELIDENIYSKVDYGQKPIKWTYLWTFNRNKNK